MSHHTTESLTARDLLACVETLRRYATVSLAPRCERPEHPLSAAALREALQALQDLGVLNPDDLPAWGCWDDDAHPWVREWSWQALKELGRVNVGLAVAVHMQAMSWQLDRRAGGAPRSHGALVCNGFLGLGRDAVVADVLGGTLSDEQGAWMADNWAWRDIEHPRYLYAWPDWAWVWVPVWSREQGWTWCQVSRDQCEAQALPRAHGLDELTLFAVSVRAEHVEAASQQGAVIRGPAAREAWVHVQAMHAMGLLAIGAGALTTAWHRARDFAEMRHQGGQTIIGHAAVQALLAEASGAIHEAEQALRTAVSPVAQWPDLRQRWTDRLRHQANLSAGASAAMQVFGGMGYMQDNGMEKTLRDLNVLRLMVGAPAELRTILASWDRVRPRLREMAP